jgi:hypothetical protein
MMRALALLAIALAGASVVLFVWAPFADTDPGKADAIVVLAGSRSRLPVGLDLFRRGVAPTLAISVDPSDKQRARYCRLPGQGAFCFRADPFSTQGEARAVARLARERHWRTIAVVTSRFHLFRTRMLLRRCTEARLELVPAKVAWWRWPEFVVTEWAKTAVALTTRRGC